MKLAVDVFYEDTHARVAGVLFDEWRDPRPRDVFKADVDQLVEYEPGHSYKRELPCLIRLFEQIDLAHISHIIVDGYVVLDDKGKPGLGWHVHRHLSGSAVVIGVSKTTFRENTLNVRKVVRGKSGRPLYVTAIGMGVNEAAKLVRCMHGPYRIPTLLKWLRRENRQYNTPVVSATA